MSNRRGRGNPLTKDEYRLIKMLIDKEVNSNDIAKVINRNASTIGYIKRSDNFEDYRRNRNHPRKESFTKQSLFLEESRAWKNESKDACVEMKFKFSRDNYDVIMALVKTISMLSTECTRTMKGVGGDMKVVGK